MVYRMNPLPTPAPTSNPQNGVRTPNAKNCTVNNVLTVPYRRLMSTAHKYDDVSNGPITDPCLHLYLPKWVRTPMRKMPGSIALTEPDKRLMSTDEYEVYGDLSNELPVLTQSACPMMFFFIKYQSASASSLRMRGFLF